jgi:hypothetical protein
MGMVWITRLTHIAVGTIMGGTSPYPKEYLSFEVLEV